MEIKYKSNLVAGIVSIILGIVCIILVPLQIAEDYSATYGITSRTIPGANLLDMILYSVHAILL